MVFSAAVDASAQECHGGRSWRTAFRTNLFAPALNVGIEVAFGERRNIIIGTEFWYPWLRPFIKDNATCIEGLCWGLDGRYYLLRRVDPCSWASGLYIGLSVAGGYYDLCFKGDGMQGELFSSSLFVGWSFPVNRGRWRLSLDIGGGCLVSRYREYHVWEDGLAYRPGDWEGLLRWWGPSRAAVSLHVPIWYDMERRR